MRVLVTDWWSLVSKITFAGVGVFALLFAAAPSMAIVTITDCASDSHCVAINKRTAIDVPGDTVIIAGAITPLPGTEVVRIRAQAIIIEAAGSIDATGKGRAIELDAEDSVTVNGDLTSVNTNGKIMITGAQLVKIQGPLDIESGGDIDIQCTAAGCQVMIVASHLKANRVLIDSDGPVTWDSNFVEIFGPRDLFKLNSKNGAIKKSGPLSASLAAEIRGQGNGMVDALSEAQAFCECQVVGTPTPTPLDTGFPTPTATPTSPVSTPTPTATPSSPVETATLPNVFTFTPTPGGPTPTPTLPGNPTPTPTQPVVTATPTVSATPTSPVLTPTATPTPERCNEIIGGVESTLSIIADGDIDFSCTKITISENIVIKATGNIDLTNAIVRNDAGKCGEIEITAGNGAGQINILGATLVDDDCRGPDVSELNNREQVPHVGFNNVVGTPILDD